MAIGRDQARHLESHPHVKRVVTRYSGVVIRSFQHKGLQAFFERGSKAGIQPGHAARLARQLAQLHAARMPRDMNVPGWRLHALSGDLKEHWSVWVNGNWRLTFRYEAEDAVLVDYQDYHQEQQQ